MSALATLGIASRWAAHHADICRRHRNVIGVWESPDGDSYALLLRDTLVPLRYESRVWLKHTRATARAIMRELRLAGLRQRFVVLQWRPLEAIAEVLETWFCRYDADPARREQHARFVATELADRRFLRSQYGGHPSSPTLRVDLSGPIV